MTPRSAGLLLYRRPAAGETKVLIAHMGGPFWDGKDARAWTIPKGEYGPDEDPWRAARREFEEEVGRPPPLADYIHLGDFRQPSGKVITVFAAESEFDPDRFTSNTFPLVWPRGSGHVLEFPEIDALEWVEESEARTKLVRGQVPILDLLLRRFETLDAGLQARSSSYRSGESGEPASEER